MFRLFKDVQKMGGHEGVSEAKGWEDLAGRMGFPDMGQAMRDVYLRYLGDFQVHAFTDTYRALFAISVRKL